MTRARVLIKGGGRPARGPLAPAPSGTPALIARGPRQDIAALI